LSANSKLFEGERAFPNIVAQRHPVLEHLLVDLQIGTLFNADRSPRESQIGAADDAEVNLL
jgi:hypothetical protein